MKADNAWMCTVCGYIHEGANPPDACPVCGATADLFEPYAQVPAKSATPATEKWRCLNCEYIHKGDTPPAFCPVCGAPAERFAPHGDAPAISRAEAETGNVVIVGAGIAGVSAAEAVRTASPHAGITLISKEAHLPYYRLNLTRYLAGDVTAEQLPLHPQQWYDMHDIALTRDAELCSVDTSKKSVRLRQGDDVPYDKLVLAIGSHPFVPPLPGNTRENVTTLRTKDDADFIQEMCAAGARCVVIGGGLLGLETAGALAMRGADVSLLEGHGWLLPRQLNQRAGQILEEKVHAVGVRVHRLARTKEILGDQCARGLLLENGETIQAELVVVATGVRSNSYVARLAGLEVNRGVVVDNHLGTSDPCIFAAGDVAEHHGISYGSWGPSQFQGTIAGGNAVGTGAQFAGIPRANMLKVLGYDLFSVGQVTPEDASYTVCESSQEESGHHYFFMFRDSHLVGAILLGDTHLSAEAKRTIEQRVDCSSLLHGHPEVARVLEFLEG